MGYRVIPTYRDIELPIEGSPEPFRATVRKNLTFREINAIPLKDATYQDLFQAMASYVTAWNQEVFNIETGEWEPAPPPAEAGPDAFLVVENFVTAWIAAQLKFGHLGDDDRKKDSTPLESTDDSSSGKSTTSAPKSRESRTS